MKQFQNRSNQLRLLLFVVLLSITSLSIPYYYSNAIPMSTNNSINPESNLISTTSAFSILKSTRLIDSQEYSTLNFLLPQEMPASGLLRKPSLSPLTYGTPHSPIIITSDSNFATQAGNEMWPGNGSASNPYIIESFDIDVAGGNYGVHISDTTVYFIIQHCFIQNAIIACIFLERVQNGQLFNNTCYDYSTGILLEDSDDNQVIKNNCTMSKYGGYGIDLDDSHYNVIANNTCSDNDSRGIYLYWSDFCQLINNTCYANDRGIITNAADHTTLTDNTCYSNTLRGIVFWGGDQLTVANNTVYNTGAWGFEIDGVYDSTFSDNLCYQNSHGMYIEGNSQENQISDNTCYLNDYGIFLSGSRTNSIVNNNCSDNNLAGISLYNSDLNNLSDNICETNLENGISLTYSDSNTLEYNNCSSNTLNGIHLINSISNRLTDNICQDSDIGINVEYSTSNELIDNLCQVNDFGILLNNSKFSQLSHNTCESNSIVGIRLYQANSSTVIYNDVKMNNIGILLEESDSNKIYYNTFEDNTWYGVRVIGFSHFNQIKWNLLQTNVNNALDNCTNNLFDYNYWSNCTGPDANSDGIGDIPHPIPGWGNNTDPHPALISPLPPTWLQPLVNQTVELGTSFTYDVNADAIAPMDTYWINNTFYFAIDDNGVISNKGLIPVGTYWLLIIATNVYQAQLTGIFNVTVIDTTPPIWLEQPQDLVILHTQDVAYQVPLPFDLSGIWYIWLEGADTSRFDINETGYLTNTMSLSPGVYNITVVAEDPYYNKNSVTFFIDVKEYIFTVPEVPWADINFWVIIICSIIGGVVILYLSVLIIMNFRKTRVSKESTNLLRLRTPLLLLVLILLLIFAPIMHAVIQGVTQPTWRGEITANQTIPLTSQSIGDKQAPIVPNPSSSNPYIIWNQTFSFAQWDSGYSLIACSDGGYLIVARTVTDTNSDFLTIRTDANGNQLWNRTFGGPDHDYPYQGIECSDGGFAIIGYTDSFGLSTGAVVLLRYDASGTLLWYQTYDGSSSDYGYSLTEFSGGGYLLTGYTYSYGVNGDMWLIHVDSSGTHLWNRTYGGAAYDAGRSVIECSTGGFAIAGRTSSYGVGTDVWLVRTLADGTAIWNTTYGGSNYEEGNQLIETADGGFAVVGTTGSYGAGSGDGWVVRTNDTGIALWNQTFGGANNDEYYSIIECSSGGFVVVGQTFGFGPGFYDATLNRINSAGQHLWNLTVGGIESDAGYSVVKATTGGYVFVGYTQPGPSETDVWLVYLSPIAWWPPPIDMVIETDSTYHLDISVRTLSTIDYWWLNDLTHFSIQSIEYTEGGIARITTIGSPSPNTYNLILRVNDTNSDYIQVGFALTITAVAPPTWVEAPTDQSMIFGERFRYQLNATDESGIDYWWLDDTEYFSINRYGVITDNDILPVGIYTIQVSVNDTLGNTLTSEFFLTVIAGVTPLPWLPTVLAVTILVVVIVVLLIIYKKVSK